MSEKDFKNFVVLPDEEFEGLLRPISTLLKWSLDDEGIKALRGLFPTEIRAEAFMSATDIAGQQSAKLPTDLVAIYKQQVLRSVAAKKHKALPPAPVTSTPCQEQVRFFRFMRQLASGEYRCTCGKSGLPKTLGGCPNPCECYVSAWNEPLTDEDWNFGKSVSPAQVISTAADSMPTSDPKEHDLVWVEA